MDADTLQRDVIAALDRWTGGLGGGLGAAWRAFADRIGLSGAAAPGYFLHPLAMPTLQLPAWAAAAARRAGGALGDAEVGAIAEAAGAGYLHVRLQDDLLDEGTGDPGEVMLLAEALLARHGALLGRLRLSGAFWGRYEALWRGYAEAMALERALHATGEGWDEAAFARVLERSAPLALPPLAALDRAGAPGLAEPLEAFVRELARAHQLELDLVDTEKDLAAGNLTWQVVRHGGLAGRDALRRRLWFEGGFDAAVAEAGAGYEAAAGAARAADLPEGAAFCARRREALEAMQRRVLRGLFEGLLGGERGGPAR